MVIKATAPLNSGFTLVELLIVLAMVTVIVSLSSINLTGLISDTSTDEVVELVVSDIKRQQLRSMVGEERNGFSMYGVHFDADKYVLFSGPVYDPAESSNTVVSLPEALQFESITIPDGTIIFLPQSGAVDNYNAATDSVILRHSGSSENKQLEFNVLGVIEVI